VDAYLDVSVRFELDIAARSGSLRLFDHVTQRVHTLAAMKDWERQYTYGLALKAAIASGSLAVVQRVLDLDPAPFASSPMNTAVNEGQLEILAWLFASRSDETCAPCPPEEYLATHPRGSLDCCLAPLVQLATDRGHARIVRWLVEHGCSARLSESVAVSAAKEGDLETIQWLHEHKVTFTFSVMDTAARYDHLEVVEFLHLNRSEGCSALALIYAVVYEHDAVATYLRTQKLCLEVDERIITEAASAGRVDLLIQYAPEFLADRHDARLVRRAMTCALMVQQLQVLQWLYHERNVTGMPVTMLVPTDDKPVDLDVFQWIHNTPQCGHWTPNVLEFAIRYGHATLVEWLLTSGREGHDFAYTGIIDEAALNGHLDVVRTLHRLCSRRPICTESAIDNATSRGHLKIAQWLHENRSEGCGNFALENAIAAGHLDAARWLIQAFPGRLTDSSGRVYQSLEEVEARLNEIVSRRYVGVLGSVEQACRTGDERQCRLILRNATLAGHLCIVQQFADKMPESFNADYVLQLADNAHHGRIVAWIRSLSKDKETLLGSQPTARRSLRAWFQRRLRRGDGAVRSVS
jgi:hypothetical protein